MIPASDSTLFTSNGPQVLQRALSTVFTGYFYDQNPYFALSKMSPLNEIFDCYNVSRVLGDIYKNAGKGSKDGYHVVARSLLQEPLKADETKFKKINEASTVADNYNIRYQRGNISCVSENCHVSGVEFLSYLLMLPFRSPDTFQGELRRILTENGFFDNGKSIFNIAEIRRAMLRFNRELGYRTRRESFKNANIVIYNPAKVSGNSLYDNPIEVSSMIEDAVSRIQDVNCGLHYLFDGRYAVIVPPFIKNQIQKLTAFSYLNNLGYLNKGFDPSDGMMRIPFLTSKGNVVSDGSNYFCEDFDNKIHESGSASTLTDLTISKNTVNYDLGTADILTSGYQTVEISSAATDTFTLKQNDIIIVKDKFFLKRKDRPTGYTLGINDVSDAPLCLIVQEDATSATKKITVKVSPDLYDGVNVKLSDLAVGAQVSVVPNHRKIFVCPMTNVLYSRIFAASLGPADRGYILNDRMDPYTGLNGTVPSGVSVLFEGYEDSVTNDMNTLFALRSYFTLFSFQFESAQVVIPVEKPSASQYVPTYLTKVVTP